MPKKLHNNLNDLRIKKAKARGYLCDGGGLYLQVTNDGAGKSWVFRYLSPETGKKRELGLGPYPDLGLARARDKAQELREKILDGIDPLTARDQIKAQKMVEQAKALTFSQAAERYIEAKSPGWANPRHAKQWSATLGEYAFPILGQLPIAAIDTGLVTQVLEPIWNEKRATASRVRGRIELVLNWAKALGYRSGENPARWRGHLDQTLAVKSKKETVNHHPALPYQELPAFMTELRGRDGVSSLALQLTILTTARTGETLGMKWEEIDLQAKVWTVPAERMKMGEAHRVALNKWAMEILNNLPRAGDFVFERKGGGKLSERAMIDQLAKMGRKGLTVHGFRSTFSDWVSEETGFHPEVREMALAHKVGSDVQEAYRRGDMIEKRRELAEAWGRYCEESPAPSNVIKLRDVA